MRCPFCFLASRDTTDTFRLEGGGGGGGGPFGSLLLWLLLLLLLEEKDVNPRLELVCHAAEEPTDTDGSVGHLVAYWTIPRGRCRPPSTTNEAMARFMLLTLPTRLSVQWIRFVSWPFCSWFVGLFLLECRQLLIFWISVERDDVADECVHVWSACMHGAWWWWCWIFSRSRFASVWARPNTNEPWLKTSGCRRPTSLVYGQASVHDSRFCTSVIQSPTSPSQESKTIEILQRFYLASKKATLRRR
jgi:hypothetical protein